MKILENVRWEKIFTKIFWIWISISCAILSITIYILISNNPDIVRFTSDTIPYFIKAIIAIEISGFGYVIKFEFLDRPNVDRKRYPGCIVLMTAILTSIIIGFVLTFIYSHPSKPNLRIMACKEVVNDASLYKNTTTTDNRRYAIAKIDSVDVTSLNCEEYYQKKMEIRKELLSQCNIYLKKSNIYPSGDQIYNYLQPGDTNQAIISELMHLFYLRIQESTYKFDSGYYYKATICVAKDNAFDSLVDLALTKYCMRWAVRDMLNKSPQINYTLTTSLSSILKTVCEHCPSNKYVIEIKKMCGGTYDCDSIYFRSGKYQLSNVSKMILECFIQELQGNKQTNFSIDFYGYTDPRRVLGPLVYKGGASCATIPCTLLPDPNHYFKRMDSIVDNYTLSYARGYSCYEFMTSEFSRKDIQYRYTGCGVSDATDNISRQRTVKIVINKKVK